MFNSEFVESFVIAFVAAFIVSFGFAHIRRLIRDRMTAKVEATEQEAERLN